MEVDKEGLDFSIAVDNLLGIVGEGKVTEMFAAGEKEFHSSINKLGKQVDKSLERDVGRISFHASLPTAEVNALIIEHFLQQGYSEAALLFAKECGLPLDKDTIQPYEEMNRCVQSLKSKDFEPPIRWVQMNKNLLDEKSPLEFELHKHQFIDLVAANSSAEALAYAQTHFAPFMAHHAKDIQRLMGSLLYCGSLQTSPYFELVTTESLHQLCSLFRKEYCIAHKLSTNSTLLTCARVSSRTFAPLLKAKAIVEQTQQPSGEWCSLEKLPVELKLDPTAFAYHTIFTCPVSKELSTDSNPPVLLPCGHVVSKRSIEELDAVLSRPKLKCPYCPTKLKLADTQQITF